MKQILSNVFKGLLTALVVIIVGGIVLFKVKMPPQTVMTLVSSSLVNSIGTSNSHDQEEVSKEEDLEVKLETEEEKEVETPTTNTKPKQEEIVQEPSVPQKEPVKEIQIKVTYSPNLEVLNTVTTLETYHGKMTAYGPDCLGCSGITASGKNVLDGNIYYEDKTFGTIRIVAADKSIPFGSIIKITGLNISSDPILAIVLDRGGMIGFEEWKHSYFDLLYKSEADAMSFGRPTATFELIRRGY